MPCQLAGHFICIKKLKGKSDDVHRQHKEDTHERKDHSQVLPFINDGKKKQECECQE